MKHVTLFLILGCNIISYAQNTDIMANRCDSIACEMYSATPKHFNLTIYSQNNQWLPAVQYLNENDFFRNDRSTPGEYFCSDGIPIISEKTDLDKPIKLKSGFSGFVLSFLPLAGHIYAGKPVRGFMFTGLTLASVTSMAVSGVLLEIYDNPLRYFFAAAGMIGLPVTLIWKIVDVQKIIKTGT